MHYLQQIAFVLLLLAAVWFFSRQVKFIRRNILLGKEENFSDHPDKRWKNVLLLAFGQKKMFKNPLVAILHFIIYAGFIIINLEVLEIVLDGILGTHRLFTGFLGMGFYRFLINSFEWLALGVLVVCVIFLTRRNMLKIRRFISNDLDGWPRSDANYILITEIVLMLPFLTMNAADVVLQERGVSGYADHATGAFAVSSFIQPMLNSWSDNSLILLERICWWLHIAGILAFLNYLHFSNHLHILLAFPNAYFARL